MTPIEVGANPKRAKAAIAERAEEFLQDRGFLKGHHFDSELEAITLATKVQIELSVRTGINEEGFYGFSVECSNYRECRPDCRGWDGKAERCECEMHCVELVVTGIYPSTSCSIDCVCCVDCNDRGCESCEQCGRRYCDDCLGEHAHYVD